MENWKTIDGYDGMYQVSDYGRIKSLKNSKVIIMKLKTTSKKYLSIGLIHQNKKKWFSVHRLVATYFIPNPENKPEVNHKNGIKSFNFVNNLEWNTRKENNNHALSTGLRVGVRGVESHYAKLTEKEVIEIRKIGRRMTCIEVGKLYNIANTTVSAILKRKIWKHI